MTSATAEIDAYLAAFAERDRERSAAEPEWLRARRRGAISRLEALGLPTGREEAWRQTPVAPLVSAPFRLSAGGDAPAAGRALDGPGLGFPGPIRIVLVDGRFAPALSSLPGDGGVFAGSLDAAMGEIPSELERSLIRAGAAEARPFAAMNAALFPDAAAVRIRAGATIGEAVHIVHVASRRGPAEMSCPRSLVVAGPGSRATVVETFLSDGGVSGLSNAVAEIEVGDGASLDHVRVQAEGPDSLHLGALDARLGRDSRFASHVVSLGARWARVEIGAALEGPGSECFLNGLYLADGARHADHRTAIDHAVPHGSSHQLYKGILGGASRAVFVGRILVRPDAQKTDAFQSNRNLLLSEDALVFTRPQLEIHANDVKCTHGATVGRLDAEALFYLRSRGMDTAESRRLLIRAFTGEVLERIPIAAVRERIENEVASRLPAEAGGRGAA